MAASQDSATEKDVPSKTAPAEQNGRKRSADDSDSSSSDDDFGPARPSDVPAKKRRRLPHEKLYISALPQSSRYSRSLMHRDQVAHVTVTPFTDFIITSSADGVVKFWKKAPTGEAIEPVKEFRTHAGEIRSVSASLDGRAFATAGVDGTIKIFDVVNFDLLAIIPVNESQEAGEGGTERKPWAICWIHRRGASIPKLAVSFESSNEVAIYDGRGESTKPLHVIANLHKSPVRAIAYNSHADCVITSDMNGMLEYWRPTSPFDKPEGVFTMKSTTDLFAFKKSKSSPVSITMSPSGAHFATFSLPDAKIRVFDFATGKLYRTYDESITTNTQMQEAGTALHKLEDVEFGRRLATERMIDSPSISARINVIFDESSNFILYGSLYGVKVINTLTNRVVKVYGDFEPFRALHLALYQGAPQKKSITTVEMAASENPLLQEAEERDPLLFCTALGKPRFYMFSNTTTIDRSSRDIQNEKPRAGANDADANGLNGASKDKPFLPVSATIHTTLGDIPLRLFPQIAPKAVENFTTHARNNYYSNTIFHRVIKKFMIQGGDPLGDGTGGTSIWNREFEDEFHPDFKHDQPFTLSMANAGPNTNGSQFFITTEKCTWLDGKHTVFGRCTGGVDVVKRIEGVRVYKERPEEEIKILSVDVA